MCRAQLVEGAPQTSLGSLWIDRLPGTSAPVSVPQRSEGVNLLGSESSTCAATCEAGCGPVADTLRSGQQAPEIVTGVGLTYRRTSRPMRGRLLSARSAVRRLDSSVDLIDHLEAKIRDPEHLSFSYFVQE